MTNNLPQNPQAERAVIGACLCFDSESRIGEISEILKPEDFYDVNNKIAYEICVDMYFSNKPVDGVTFQDEAIKRNVFNQLGGQPFLAELMNDTAIIANAGYYAEIVKNLSIRRKVIEAGNKITSLALQNDIKTSELRTCIHSFSRLNKMKE